MKLAGEATLFTAFGDDEIGHRSADGLRALGLRVEAVFRPETQRRGFVHLDDDGERTITVLGPRLGPSGGDPLPWEELGEMDAVYFTAGDAAAASHARRARRLVSTARGIETLAEAHVELDALVASRKDRGERYRPGDIEPPPHVVVRTAGSGGGDWEAADGSTGRWAGTELPGPVADAYGCGDSFAAGLTYGLGDGRDIDSALLLAARCGAACLTGRGPYAGQLRSP
jgi:ribokinase